MTNWPPRMRRVAARQLQIKFQTHVTPPAAANDTDSCTETTNITLVLLFMFS